MPHTKKNMTTRFGRIVHRMTYFDIALLGLVVIASSSFWFKFAPYGHGLKPETSTLSDCLYFSFVTFTSLGYGDLVPIGFGRVVAIVNVLSGLTLTATFIGKVASERQFAVMMLLHTSDTQRRISGFSMELEKIRSIIDLQFQNYNSLELRESLADHIKLTKSIGNYLMFNAHQASIIEFGNFTALIGLYDEIRYNFDVLSQIHKKSHFSGDIVVIRRSYSNMHNLYRIVQRMGALQRKPRGQDALWQVALRALLILPEAEPSTAEQSARNRLSALAEMMAKRTTAAEIWTTLGRHPVQIERVFNVFPTGPKSSWPPNIHKEIANLLKISNSCSQYCINELIKINRLPK
jgi:hypothetical protein